MKNLFLFLFLFFIACEKESSGNEGVQNTETTKNETSETRQSDEKSQEEAPAEEEPNKSNKEVENQFGQLEESKNQDKSSSDSGDKTETSTELSLIEKIKNYFSKKEKEKTPEELIADAKQEQEKAKEEQEKAKEEQKEAEELMAKAKEEKKESEELMAKAREYNNKELLTRFKNRISFWGNILAILTVCGLGAALYHIYGWRRYHVNGNWAIKLPEQYYEENDKRLHNVAEKTNSFFEKMGTFINKISKENQENSDEIQRQLSLLIDQVDEEKQKNKDLQNGYHNNITKNFVDRLLRIRDRLEYYVEDENTSEDVKKIMIKELDNLDKFLKGEGVYKISLQKGESIKGSDGKYRDGLDMKEGIETEDKDLQGTVIETLKIGFYLVRSNEKKDIIQPAEIKFYNEGENIEEAPVEEAPAEEETPAEETPAEEAPAEEEAPTEEESPIVDISENHRKN